MKEQIVKIEALSHRYFSTDWAVDNVSFNINKHGVLGLLGSNGAGKSTIMNIMCGVLNQTQGRVIIDGVDTRRNSLEAKKKIGFLPQKAPLYLDSTIDEYLTYCAYLRRVPSQKVRQAVDRVKEQCGLTHFSARIIKNLSGGFRQRVGIASAIIHDPKLVVLDEPTVGLDPVQVVEVRKIIQGIGQDRSVIFSTHMMAEVQALCDELKMIERGKLAFSGTVAAFNNQLKPSSLIVTFNKAFKKPKQLAQIDGVNDVEIVPETVDDALAVRLNVAPEALNGISEKVIMASIENQWQLREIMFEKSSLEDVFAKLANDTNQ